jgi:hypothetical protein
LLLQVNVQLLQLLLWELHTPLSQAVQEAAELAWQEGCWIAAPGLPLLLLLLLYVLQCGGHQACRGCAAWLVACRAADKWAACRADDGGQPHEQGLWAQACQQDNQQQAGVSLSRGAGCRYAELKASGGFCLGFCMHPAPSAYSRTPLTKFMQPPCQHSYVAGQQVICCCVAATATAQAALHQLQYLWPLLLRQALCSHACEGPQHSSNLGRPQAICVLCDN